MKTGAELIAEERQRQIEVEGFTPNSDRIYTEDDLAMSASVYALPDCMRRKNRRGIPSDWPFADMWWKPSPDNRIRELQKAGALIAAEIDRLQNTPTATND